MIAASRAKFTLAYTKVGLTPDGSASFYLARAIGLRRAMDLVLTNRVLTAAEAEAWGLVNRVVDDDDVEKAAEELVASLAAGPTGAFGAAKRLLVGGTTRDLATALAQESETISRISGSADTREGVAAFLEQTRPALRPPLSSEAPA